ncbi:MAG: hypothetical protein AB7G34_14750 [Hyphomicrobiales bacterium]
MPKIAIGADDLAALYVGEEEVIAAYVGAEQVYEKAGAGLTPGDVAGLQFWFRSDMGVTQSEGLLSGWGDLSGLDRHLSSSGGGRPAFSAAGGPNGLPAIVADGSDWMDSASFALAQPIHVFMVIRIDSYANNDRVLALATSSEAVGMTGSALMQNFGSAGGNTISPSTGVWCLVESYCNGASSYMRLNGGAKSDGTNPGTNAISSGITLFNRPQHDRPAACAVAEIAMYNAEITGDGLAALMGYFSSRYGLF